MTEGPALRQWCRRGAIAACLVLFVVVCFLSPADVLWPDDQYTDMNILMSGENFARHGLLRLRLLPVHHLGPMLEPPIYYTHYPPLSNVVNGLLQTTGIRSVSIMRIFCGLLFVAGLFFCYRAFAPLVGSLASLSGLLLLGTTGFFFTYSISLHHPFDVLLMGLFFLLLLRALGREQPGMGAWAACWAVLALESLNSFEFILYPQVFAWVYVLVTGQLRRRWKALLVLASAPVVGVGLHFLQNVWALGYSGAVEDAIDAFKRPGRGPAQNRWDVLKSVPGFALREGQRLYYWPWTVLVVLAGVWSAWGLTRSTDDRSSRPAAGLFLALVAASLTWYVFMPDHVVKHPHTVKQLFPLFFVAMGCTMAFVARRIFRPSGPLAQKVLLGAVAAVVIFGQSESIRGCFQRAESRPTSFHVFEALGDVLPEKVAVLTNTYADAQLAYFLRRPVWRSPTPAMPFPQCVADLQGRLPKDWELQYYLFDGYGPRSAFPELAQNCRGKLIRVPQVQPGAPTILILFDIGPLRLAPEQRPRLPEELIRQQLSGRFAEFDPPGFAGTVRQIVQRYHR